MISIMIFICFHFWIIFQNYTTYEYIIKVVRNRTSNSNDITNETNLSRYNIGHFENFKQVFGSYMLLWFLPISIDKEISQGLTYEINSIYAYDLVESI